MSENQALSPLMLHTLIGKTIKWNAPSAKENRPYSGTDKIISVNLGNRNPLKTESIEGDDLQYAFIDDLMDNELLSYSDSYRVVTYKIVE